MKNFFQKFLILGLIFVSVLTGVFFAFKSTKKAVKIDITAQKILDKGINYARNNNIDAAIGEFSALTQMYPHLALGYYNLGLAYIQKNQVDASIEAWEKALSLDSKYAEVYFNLGLAYKIQHRNNKAVECFSKYILLQPNDPKVSFIKNEIEKLKQPFIGNEEVGRAFISDEADLRNNLILEPKAVINNYAQFVYAGIEFAKVKPNSKILAIWSYNDFDNNVVVVNRSQFILTGNKNVLLTLKKPLNNWPTGLYNLDIFINKQNKASLSFFISK